MPNPIFKTGMICVVLRGRHAGKKATVINVLEPTKDSKGSYVLVAGVDSLPRGAPVDPKNERAMRRRAMRTFVKRMNVNHLMPTAYTLSHSFSQKIDAQTLADKTKKTQALELVTKDFTQRLNDNKDGWFFTKLVIDA
ncbi:Ribosomal protein L27 [Giardia muris]|uniref:Ribosomal protein L27 n=1 Tax=Giardia muris TaxID=5742 RepID=A0A4Z1T380_GIAMU|nr:Ribosomal protein L27 [Giardia muris]|eukprot:TNJ28403.1 Ribosomal protein L27 [Giardia muris]